MPHDLDRGRKRLARLVDKQPESQPPLPVVHTTDALNFRDALDDGGLEPQPCNVYEGECLTYLFVGRPLFPPNSSADPSKLSQYYPVCILFKPEIVAKAKRILPFDSGGFVGKLYARVMHPKMRLGDFLLEPDARTPGKFISLFFGGASAYMNSKVRQDIDVDPAEFEAQSLHALISDPMSNPSDERGAGIEVQVGSSIPFKDNVAAVILPATFENSEISAAIKALGAEPIYYDLIGRIRPSEYSTNIYGLCREFYLRKGWIS